MMRRTGRGLFVLAVLMGACVAAASASAATVTGTRTTTTDLVRIGASTADVSITWAITPPADTGNGRYKYDYSFVGTGTYDVPATWYLQVSPIDVGVDPYMLFYNADGTQWSSGGSNPTIGAVSGLGGGSSFYNAITFTSAYADGNGHYIFQTPIDPAPGKAYMVTADGNVKNAGFGDTTIDFENYGRYVMRVDYGSINQSMVPEPSLSLLALIGLVTGGFARWRRKKEA